MKAAKLLLFILLLLPLSVNFADDEGEGELVVIKPSQLREEPSSDSKLIFNLYPTLLIRRKLEESNGWIRVDSGFCTLKKEHEICNSAEGYIPSEALAKFDRSKFVELKLPMTIKFTNFNSNPELKYVLEKDGSFYHFDPMCGGGTGKCGKSKLFRIHNIIWGKPLASDFVYKFFINEKGQICAPYPGKDHNYPCSQESIR
ncbi:hypothetical protein [Leptospira neocaledonica]|uniref:SH3b domain-containing protein n=1 Tax=Leptospira neocaledonica TaxID=2023192 RepID=A0A2M9ZTL0_9LEPT|nr:hypothetical protein [Leptospira neocaledonica]PJZ75299.1 hypothetical protein CH365_19665 [Leptospira neocaledonica]